MSAQLPSTNTLDHNGLADYLAEQDSVFEVYGEKIFEPSMWVKGDERLEIQPLPKRYAGDDFKSPKELAIGQKVVHDHYGSPRIVTVLKRHRFSVTVGYQGRTYGCSLYELRRIEER